MNHSTWKAVGWSDAFLRQSLPTNFSHLPSLQPPNSPKNPNPLLLPKTLIFLLSSPFYSPQSHSFYFSDLNLFDFRIKFPLQCVKKTLDFSFFSSTRSQTLGFSPNLGFRIWSERPWLNHAVESPPERDRDREARMVSTAEHGGRWTRRFGALQLDRRRRRHWEPRLWDNRELCVQGRTGWV